MMYWTSAQANYLPANDPMRIVTNYEIGQLFLRDNAKAEGVITTSSGLQYKILKEGKGVFPSRHNRVKVFYQGKNLKNQIFDTNFNQKPITFGLREVIKGWTEGLTKISEGGRIQLFIPSNLAYGRQGAPPNIGEDETLVFIIDLIKVY